MQCSFNSLSFKKKSHPSNNCNQFNIKEFFNLSLPGALGHFEWQHCFPNIWIPYWINCTSAIERSAKTWLMLGKLNLQQISSSSGLLEKQPRRRRIACLLTVVFHGSYFCLKLGVGSGHIIILLNHFLRLL